MASMYTRNSIWCSRWSALAVPHVELSSFMFKTLDCTLHLFGLNFSWKFCFLLQINCSFPVHSLYCVLKGFIPGIALNWINPKIN